MRTKLRQLLAAGLLTVAASWAVAPANAQSIKLGNTDREVMNIMANSGFDDVVITRRTFSNVYTEACKDGSKFRVKVSILGRIKDTTRIGRCGQRFSTAQATKAMERAGYEDIQAQQRGKQVVATGCLQGRKYGLTYNLRGDLIDRSRRGRCGNQGLKPREIARQLQTRGYDRVRFTDAQLPRYVAEACSDRTKVRLELNRRGQIRSEREIGKCPGRIDPKNLTAVLRQQGLRRVEEIQVRRAPYMMRGCRQNDRVELIISRYGDVQSETKVGQCRRPVDPANLGDLVAKNGYDRVKVLRGNRTPYLVEACKNEQLFELAIGRFGKIQKEDRVGRCAAPMSREKLAADLTSKGFYNVDISQPNGSAYRVTACEGSTKVRFRVGRFGQMGDKTNVGVCKSETVFNVLDNLRQRGAENVKLFVEGCFRNNMYRWEFDQSGNRTGRERLGRRCQ